MFSPAHHRDRPRILYGIFLALLLALIGSIMPSGAAAATEAPVERKLWVSDAQGVQRVEPAPLPGAARLADSHNTAVPTVLAVDPANNMLWIWGEVGLERQDLATGGSLLAGAEQLQPGGPSGRLAAVATDGSVWLASGQSLWSLGTGGQLLNLQVQTQAIRDLTLGNGGTWVWFSTGSRVTALDAVTGDTVRALELPAGLDAIALVPARDSEALWIATPEHLVRYDAAGELVARSSIADPAGISTLATDGANGAWLALAQQLLHIDEAGRIDRSLEPLGAETPILALAYDAANRAVLALGHDRLAQVGAEGWILESRELAGTASGLALIPGPLDFVAPVLGIGTVTSHDSSSDERPVVELTYRDDGSGIRQGTAAFLLDGAPIEAECAYLQDTATCHLLADLAPGVVEISVTVADQLGNVSAPAVRRFRVSKEEAEPGSGDENLLDTRAEPDFAPLPPTYTPVASPRGIRPNVAYVSPSDLDHIDTSSGNLTLRLPLGQRYTVGPLLSYGFQLVYNSNIWEHHDGICNFVQCGTGEPPAIFALTNPNNNAGLGWEIHPGRLYAPNAPGHLPGLQSVRWPNRDKGTRTNRWMYVAPDGAVHYLDALPGRDTGTGALPVRYSTDGSHLRMRQVDADTMWLEFPNGTYSIFERTGEALGTSFCENTGTGCWRFAAMHDYAGNWMEVTYRLGAAQEEKWEFTDSANRLHVLTFSTDPIERGGNDCNAQNFCTAANDEWGDLRRVLKNVEVAKFGGGFATYTVVTAVEDIQRGCPHDPVELPTSTRHLRIPILQQVNPPLGQPYKITTHLSPGNPTFGCDVLSGKVTELVAPTRGKIEYIYHNWQFPTRCSWDPDQDAEFTYAQQGIGERITYLPSSSGFVEEGRTTYSSMLHAKPVLTGADLSGPNCRRDQWRETVVDEPKFLPQPAMPLNNRHRQTKYYNALYQGPRFPSQSNLPSIDQWQVIDHSLPFTKEHSVGATRAERMFLSREIFQCDEDCGGKQCLETCTKKRSHYLRYGSEWLPQCLKSIGDGAGCFKFNPTVTASQTVFHDDGGRWVHVTNKGFDGAGHFREVTTDDDFADPTSRWVKTTWTGSSADLDFAADTGLLEAWTPTTHLPGLGEWWILGTYSKQQHWEQASNRTYTTEFQFDDTGLLQCRRHWKSSTRGTKDLLLELVRGTSVGIDAGLPVQEIVVGGEFGNGLILPNICPGTAGQPENGTRFVLQHQYQHYSLSHTYIQGYPDWYRVVIDRNTGLPSATFNVSDQETTHDYDALGRLTGSVPEASLRQAETQIVYSNTAGSDASVIETQVDGATELTWQKTFYDGFGRVKEEHRRRPNGATTSSVSKRVTTYDEASQVRSVSSWLPKNFDVGGKATFYNVYDAFGRPWRVKRPDDTVEEREYEGERVTKSKVAVRTSDQGSTEVTTKTFKDSQGRVTSVVNPLVNELTTYDPYGQRIEWKRIKDSVSQTRLYTYDARGLLLGERLPELGANGNGWITYQPDAFGQPREVADGQRTLSHSYDNAGRLVSIQQKGGQNLPWKQWTWATTNSGAGCTDHTSDCDYRQGKIIQAQRHNYPLAHVGTFVDWVVFDDLVYRGGLAQVSHKTTRFDIPGTNLDPKFQQTYAHDKLGNVTSFGYPVCLVPACADFDDVEAPALTATINHNQGLAQQVSTTDANISATFSYHPNFQMSGINYSNGVTGVFTQGTGRMNRPAQLRYHKSGATVFDTGAYDYDRAGNIWQIGVDTYHYDKLSRIVRGTVQQAGNHWEEYEWDIFGNNTLFFRSGMISPQPQTIDSASNRLLGNNDIFYDTVGNMVAIGTVASGNPEWTFTYDDLDMQTRFRQETDDKPPVVTEHFYAYDAQDHRAFTLDAPNDTITLQLRNLSGQVVREHELTRSGSVYTTYQHTKDFVYGPEGLIATRAHDGTPSFFHKDHLGTPRAITNLAGAVTGTHHYFPFGNEVPQLGQADELTVKFTGHQRDLHGLTDYMLGRTYAFPLRRFMSVDKGRDGWNMYAYVGDNPINFVDPDGLEKGEPIIDAKLVRGFAVAVGPIGIEAIGFEDTRPATDQQKRASGNRNLEVSGTTHEFSLTVAGLGYEVTDFDGEIESAQGTVDLPLFKNAPPVTFEGGGDIKITLLSFALGEVGLKIELNLTALGDAFAQSPSVMETGRMAF